MEAIRQTVKVINHKINITLPDDFNADEVDVIISMYASYSAYYDLYKKDFKNAEIAYLSAVEAGKKDATPAIRMNLLDIYKSLAEFYKKYNKLEKSVEYWALREKVGRQNTTITVILRRIGSGNIAFHSIMKKNDKKQKNHQK